MNINRDNYGAYFLDYWENNLDEQGRTELARFLEKFPELQDEFFDFQQVAGATLPQEKQIVFRQKQTLKKTEVTPFGNINQDNYETYIIASLEGDLGVEEKLQFEAFCKINPAIIPEIEFFKRTFLKPESGIVFPYKSGLKRGLMISMNPVARLAAAAAVVAFLAVSALYFFNRSGSELSKNELTFEQPKLPATETSPERTGRRETTQQQINIDPQNFARQQLKQIDPADPANQFTKPGPAVPATEPLPPATNEMPVISKIEQHQNTLSTMQTAPVGKMPVQTREEVSSVFNYMLIRDEMAYEGSVDEKEKSLVGKVLANLFNKALGIEDSPDDNAGALLAEVTERGRERISEMSERVPFFKRVEESGQLKTIFGLNENFNVKKSTPVRSPNSQQDKQLIQ